MNSAQKSGDELVKIFFDLPQDISPISSESLWAEAVGASLYRLRNAPFYMRGVSEQDIVRAEENDGRLMVTGIVDRGGHSTYRIFLPEHTSEHQFEKDWIPLHELGCIYERATRRLIAIDVPPNADIYSVYEVLEKGEKDQLWEFQEGLCGHPLRNPPPIKPNA